MDVKTTVPCRMCKSEWCDDMVRRAAHSIGHCLVPHRIEWLPVLRVWDERAEKDVRKGLSEV